MSKPWVIKWSPAIGNTTKIASLQTLTGAGDLTLNSNLPSSQVSFSGPYVYKSEYGSDDVVRTVSLTSANNLSARTFTITGIGSAVDGSGNPTGAFVSVTETRAGPNANTVYSANIYKQIDSISVNGAVTAVSAGYGSSGITAYTFMDDNRKSWAATAQVQVLSRSTLLYTTYQSITKPETVNLNGNLTVAPAAIPAFAVSAGMTGASTSQMSQMVFPVVMTWVTVSANTTANEKLYFTVLQQGLRS